MNKIETPVLLLTGYLGSGKTTLLNRILKNEKGIKFAVIVNDIGEVNIDATLIQQGGVVNQQDDSLVALQNGCICCTLKMDLVKQLQDIIQMQRFDYIVIEASGICEPGPIAQTICSIPSMDPELTKNGYPKLDCITTVVDALRMRDEFEGGALLTRPDIGEEDIENLVIQQIEFCNIVLLNKVAEVNKEELGRIRAIIRTLQPKAEIIECNYGDVNFDKILNTNMFDFDSVATSAAWIQEVERHHEEEDDVEEEEHHHHDEHEHHDHDDDEHEHHHHHHHHHHHDDEGEAEEYGISTFVYYRRGPMKLGLFDDFVARKWPKGVIRAKGICYFDDEMDMCYLFEQAGKQVSIRQAGQWFATMPEDELAQMMERDAALRADWDEKYGDRMQKIVFIGQHMDKEAITKALDDCKA
ncbi:GTP-binding protein [Prevotella sp. E15-22]|uniref:GTP-binding protein n=1 Tax=Prevotella sp. E15-22 TaxID=2937774 RepID=UPI00204DEAC2|nr:GTP-binding protein [Prevotella sp. E15-22]UPS45506.1 GTP-binding protein [Prevotella sp. E15-22]